MGDQMVGYQFARLPTFPENLLEPLYSKNKNAFLMQNKAGTHP